MPIDYESRFAGEFLDFGGRAYNVHHPALAGGAAGDGVADDAPALAAADARGPAEGSPGRTYRVASNVVLAHGWRPNGSVLLPAAGVTVRVTGPVDAGAYRWIDLALGGRVAFGPAATDAVLPEWWGAVGDGVALDSDAIQAALDAVPAQGGTVALRGTHLVDAVRRPLTPKSGTRLLLSPGAVVSVQPNGSPNYEAIRIVGVADVTVEGGTIVGDRGRHAGGRGEWGHGIFTANASGVRILDVRIRDCWGDGVTLGSAHPRNGDQLLGLSQHVYMRGVVCESNRRNGLSVVGCHDLLAEQCTFADTHGTAPQAGIDLEPDNATFQNRDLTFRRCTMRGNASYAVLCDVGGRWTSGVTFDGCTLESGREGGALWFTPSPGRPNTLVRCAIHGPIVHVAYTTLDDCDVVHDGSHANPRAFDCADDAPLVVRASRVRVSSGAIFGHFAGSRSEAHRKLIESTSFTQVGNALEDGAALLAPPPAGFVTFRDCRFLHSGPQPAHGYRVDPRAFGSDEVRAEHCYIDPALVERGAPSGWFTR